MRKKKLALVIFFGIAAVSMLFTGPVGASTVYTSEADFLAAIKAPYYLQGFNGHASGEGFKGPLFYGQDGYNYRISSIDPLNYTSGDNTGVLYWLSTGLSTNNPVDELQISFTGTNVQAVGGLFWLTYDVGDFANGFIDLTFLLSDGTDYPVTRTISSSSTRFTGFTVAGTVHITGINIINGTGQDIFLTMDHFYVGSVATPIPGAVWLLGSGLLGLVVIKGRIKGPRKRSTSDRGGVEHGQAPGLASTQEDHRG